MIEGVLVWALIAISPTQEVVIDRTYKECREMHDKAIASNDRRQLEVVKHLCGVRQVHKEFEK